MKRLGKQNIGLRLLIMFEIFGIILGCFIAITGFWKIIGLSEKRLNLTAVTTEIEDEVNNGFKTLGILHQVENPPKDLAELSARFKRITESDKEIYDSANPVNYYLGVKRKFWKLDVDTNEYVQTDAILEYITPHLYFWVEKGIDFNYDDVAKLSETFESEIYPTNRLAFGSESTPGIDHDNHLVILFARDLGGVGGYFSSTDMLPKELDAFSNQAEMFYLSADYTDLGDIYTYGVLAHEFQHMIHWTADRDESAWISEGLSELAVDINHYETGGFDYLFANNPDLQLNFWPGNDQGNPAPHYGASHLFMRYLYDRFGESFTKELVASPLNGIESIDAALEKLKRGSDVPMMFENVFQDWSIANFQSRQENFVVTEKYGEMANFPMFAPTEIITCGDKDWYERSVSQFGTDYIEINCPSGYRLELDGERQVALLPVNPRSGKYYFWSNYGDESDNKLSSTFDFTSVGTPIILSYWTWYDIERDYDYLYLSATVDGENWEILNTPTCSEDNPTGANYGCGYNGRSEGWREEQVDLSIFAGKKVTLQFDYITDMAVNGDGFVIDDVSISAINYTTDFENDQGEWVGEGFVRVVNTLPQSFAVTLMNNKTHEPFEKFFSNVGLNYTLDMPSQEEDNNSVIIISGTTRFTYQPAKYRIRVTKIE